MLITAYTTMALRCPVCGKLDYYLLSPFAIDKRDGQIIQCECGYNLLTVGRKKNTFWLEIECCMCESSHIYYFPMKAIWHNKLLTLICMETGIEIAFLGPQKQVYQKVQDAEKTVEQIAEELGYGDYFINPDIMYKTLDKIHAISDANNLSCSCGNQRLDVEVYTERVEIYCEHCGATGIVFAENLQDLISVNNLDKIILQKGKYNYFDQHKKNKMT